MHTPLNCSGIVILYTKILLIEIILSLYSSSWAKCCSKLAVIRVWHPSRLYRQLWSDTIYGCTKRGTPRHWQNTVPYWKGTPMKTNKRPQKKCSQFEMNQLFHYLPQRHIFYICSRILLKSTPWDQKKKVLILCKVDFIHFQETSPKIPVIETGVSPLLLMIVVSPCSVSISLLIV